MENLEELKKKYEEWRNNMLSKENIDKLIFGGIYMRKAALSLQHLLAMFG